MTVDSNPDHTTADPTTTLDLWDYRSRVHDAYRAVREGGPGEETWSAWRMARDELFATHPQSPVEPDARLGFTGAPFFPYDTAWRFVVEVESVPGSEVALGHSGEGRTGFRSFGRVQFVVDGTQLSLTLFWLEGYGGGVFLPFRDATSGRATYGGGRYLLDSAKGADLGHDGGRVVLDFNYAYHPSCVYSPSWSCPLAPPENMLALPIRAGERLVEANDVA